MMGQLPPAQNELFYDFCLENHVPSIHLLRPIDSVLNLDQLREHLALRSFSHPPPCSTLLSSRSRFVVLESVGCCFKCL